MCLLCLHVFMWILNLCHFNLFSMRCVIFVENVGKSCDFVCVTWCHLRWVEFRSGKNQIQNSSHTISLLSFEIRYEIGAKTFFTSHSYDWLPFFPYVIFRAKILGWKSEETWWGKNQMNFSSSNAWWSGWWNEEREMKANRAQAKTTKVFKLQQQFLHKATMSSLSRVQKKERGKN